MKQGPFTGEFQAPLQQGSGPTVRLDGNWAEQDSTFAAQVQQVIREDCSPDAEFFVRWWTGDAVSAAYDLLSRHRVSQEHERQSTSSMDFHYFSPSFSAAEFMRCQQMRDSWTHSSHVTGALPTKPQENENPRANWDGEFVPDNSLTIEQARGVLHVTANSTPVQIKSAYRRLVRMYHPDRFEGMSSLDRQNATNRMIAINSAYKVLDRERTS